MATFSEFHFLTSCTSSSLDLVVVVVEKALEDHDPDPKDQISDHIPPQAPQWEPTWHYYNTC